MRPLRDRFAAQRPELTARIRIRAVGLRFIGTPARPDSCVSRWLTCMSLARFLLVWTLLALSAAGTAAQTLDIPASVQIYSGAGANGPANLVSNAIPFRAGVVTNAANVRVLDGGVEIPVAVRVLATWPSDGSIRSLLLQFEALRTYWHADVPRERAQVGAPPPPGSD